MLIFNSRSTVHEPFLIPCHEAQLNSSLRFESRSQVQGVILISIPVHQFKNPFWFSDCDSRSPVQELILILIQENQDDPILISTQEVQFRNSPWCRLKRPTSKFIQVSILQIQFKNPFRFRYKQASSGQELNKIFRFRLKNYSSRIRPLFDSRWSSRSTVQVSVPVLLQEVQFQGVILISFHEIQPNPTRISFQEDTSSLCYNSVQEFMLFWIQEV